MTIKENLKLNPGELAEYFLPNREDLSTLYSIRSIIFNADTMQEVLNKVQTEINKILKLEQQQKEK